MRGKRRRTVSHVHAYNGYKHKSDARPYNYSDSIPSGTDVDEWEQSPQHQEAAHRENEDASLSDIMDRPGEARGHEKRSNGAVGT